MKQVVILSGKGGTGKTSVAAALAHLAGGGPGSDCQVDGLRTVLVDADVDASNLELVLSPEQQETHEFRGGSVAVIDADSCSLCGVCYEVCRFDALTRPDPEVPVVDPIACEGCAACVYQCPTNAIHMEEQVAGKWFRSQSRYGPLFHAALFAGQENSGKLVTMVKQQARLLAMDEDYELVLVDGPPGIGCPVISAASGADLALIVTEPSAAAAHDLDRVLQTTEHFGVPAKVIINKSDLFAQGTTSIEQFCLERGVDIVGHIPYDTSVTEAMVEGVPVTQYVQNPVSRAMCAVWEQLVTAVEDGHESN
jgi:MinD superfamily P-loop ATPase